MAADTSAQANSFNDHFTSIGEHINNELSVVKLSRPSRSHSWCPQNLSSSNCQHHRGEVGCSWDDQQGCRERRHHSQATENFSPSNSRYTDVCHQPVTKQWGGPLHAGRKLLLTLHRIHKSGPATPHPPKLQAQIGTARGLETIAERIVHQQLAVFLESNRLISPRQFGFTEGGSTEMALLPITETILKGMETQQLSLLTLLDLSKAFDCVPHLKLLTKFPHLGIPQHLFQNYLQGRTQSVRIGNSLFEPR